MDSKLTTGTAQRIKYTFMVVSFILFVAGWVFLGIGIWIALENNDVSIVFEIVGSRNQMVAPIFLVMLSAGAVSLISLLGFYGAHKENKRMIIICIGVSSLIFLATVIGAILALIARSQVDDRVRTTMRNSIRESYGEDTFLTNTWDYAQVSLHCCGVEDSSWGVYQSSEWYHMQPGGEEDRILVPVSCCTQTHYGEVFDQEMCQLFRSGPPRLQSGKNRALHHRGCYDVAREWTGKFGMAIAVTGFMLAIAMLLNFILAVLLLVQLKRSEA